MASRTGSPLLVPEADPVLALVVALLRGLHEDGDGVARLNGVHAVGVAEVDGVARPVGVRVARVGPQGPGGLVLVGLKADGLAVDVDLHHLLAGHGAGVAGVVLDEAVLADVLPGDLLRPLNAGVLGVKGGQGPHDVGDVHEDVGAVEGKPALLGGGDVLGVVDGGRGQPVRLLPELGVLGLGHLVVGAHHHDGLELLAPRHRPGAPTACGPLVVVDPVGEAHQVLPGRADGHHVGLLPVPLPEDAAGLVGGLAPEVGGVVDGDLPVLHQKVDGFFRSPLDEEAVKPRPLELGRGPAPHVAVRHRAREGAFGDHGEPSRHLGPGAGEGAVHDAEEVLRAQGVHLGAVLKHVLHPEAPPPHVHLQVLGVGGEVLHLARAQVNTGNPMGISAEHPAPPYAGLGKTAHRARRGHISPWNGP